MYNRTNLGTYSILFILHCMEKTSVQATTKQKSTHAHQNVSHSNNVQLNNTLLQAKYF